jgi:hypothetical protein
MVERKSSLNSFNLLMKARGATVPFSAGFVETYRNNERSAENKLGGEHGMSGIGARAGVGGVGGASASRDVPVA